VTRPIVLCTDYGLHDEFVGICHGVIATIAPGTQVIDLTHAIPRQDVVRGAIVLSRATPFMPVDAVYCAVVDPGVGSARRAIAVRSVDGPLLVGPDNGLLAPAWQELGGVADVHEITDPSVVLEPLSNTFHGRDVFAPAAAHLSIGMPPAALGPALDPAGLQLLELSGPMMTPGAIGARVVGVDGFGNVQLNVREQHLRDAGIAGHVHLGGAAVPIVAIFADLPDHGLGVIIDSQGYLALVVNQGSAAEALNLHEGSAVILEVGDAPSSSAPQLRPVD
jgi:S-adenosylmethionine hydrolase